MKKVIVIALTLVMVFALSVPAFASTTYTLSGTWKFNEVLEMSSGTQINQTGLNYTVEYKKGTDEWQITGSKISVYSADTAGNRKDTFSYIGKANNLTTGNSYSGVSPYNNGWSEDMSVDVRTVTFNGDNAVTQQFYNWFTTNATRVTEPVAPPDWDDETYPFGFIMLFPQSNEIYFYAYSVRGYANADNRFGLNGPAVGVKYQYNISAKTWTLITDLELDEGYVSWDPTLTALYWTNYNVYYEDGTPFFMVTSVIIDIVRTISLGEVLKVVLMMIPTCLAFLVGCVGLRKALVHLRKTSEKV